MTRHSLIKVLDESGIMSVATERGRDAVTRPTPRQRKASLSMQLQFTTPPLFGDPRLPARFWNKVELGPAPTHRPDLGPCWLWQGSKDKDGYGRFWNHGDGRAHKFAYECSNGSIPDGLQSDHLCRVRACVNPSHLEAVTPKVNNLRSLAPSALYAQRTKCKNGHPFTGAYRSDCSRRCLPCEAAKSQRYRARHRDSH